MESSDSSAEDDSVEGNIEDTFSMTECVKYIPAPFKQYKHNAINNPCLCGEYAIRHNEKAAEQIGTLDEEIGTSFCKITPTNAYGSILFQSDDFPNENYAKYARISKEDIDTCIKYLTHHSPKDLCDNDACISILSCHQNTNLSKSKIEILSEGIFEAAQDSNSIITISAMDNEPVSKITERLWYHNFYQFNDNAKRSFRSYIGISSWGDVTDRHLLERTNETVNYKPRLINGALPGLSRYHYQFLLLDDGTRLQHPQSSFEEMRSGIDKELRYNTRAADYGALVGVLIGGDYNSLRVIKTRIDTMIPTVVCVATGLAADLLNLAEVSGKRDIRGHITFDEELADSLMERIKYLNPPKVNRKDVLLLISSIVNAKELIKFSKLESINSFKEDIMVLLSESFRSFDDTLHFSGKWNLTEKVRQYLRDYTFGSILNIFTFALSENNVKLLDALKIEFDSLTRLTPSWFHIMANRVKESDNIHRLMSKYKISLEPDDMELQTRFNSKSNMYTAGEIQRLLIEMFDGKFSQGIFKEFIVTDVSSDEEEKLSEKNEFKFENLFIWSALLGRDNMAEFFWTLCKYPMCLAIIASHIFRCSGDILDAAYDVDGAEVYRQHADRFEELATCVSNESLKSNKVAAVDLMGGGAVLEWDSPSALELAETADCKKFLSTLPCQEAIEYLWSANIHCNIFVTMLGIFCPLLLLISSFIRFEDSYSFSIEETYIKDIGHSKPNFFQKVKRFYICPRTKFVWQLLNFLILLGISSYNLLFVMESDNVQIFEAITIALFIARILSTIVSMISTRSIDYLGSFYCVMLLLYCFLRITLQTGYVYAYTFYSIGLFFMYLDLFFYCMVSVQLGPKVTMIFHMIIELMKFLVILIIFMVPFGVAEQSTLYPYRTGYDIRLIATFFDRSFFRILGENYLEEANGEKDNCTEPADGIECPVKNAFTILLIAAYVMLTAVLLMNLLVAIFSNIFEAVNNEALTLWKSKRYTITKKFNEKSALPYPIGFIFELISTIANSVKKDKSDSRAEATPEQKKEMIKTVNSRRSLEECCRIVVADKIEEINQSSLTTKTNQVEKVIGKFEETIKLSNLAAGITRGEAELLDFDYDDYYDYEEEEESKPKSAKVRPLAEQIEEMEDQFQEINQLLTQAIEIFQSRSTKKSE